MKSSAIWVLLQGVITVGCAAGNDSQDGFVVVDSAGVMIALNSPGAEVEVAEWTIAPEPAIEIGEIEGEGPYQFSAIQGVRRLSDGTIVALDGGSRELRFFDGNGTYLHTAGRAGEGPGEFSFAQGLWVVGSDTLAVWDPNQARLTLFDQSGNYVAGIHTGTPVVSAIGLVSRRTLVIMRAAAGTRPGDPAEIMTNRQIFQILDLDAVSSPDTVAVLDGLRLLQWPSEQGIGLAPVPFTMDAVGATGAGRLVLTDGIHRELQIYTDEGELELLVRIDREPNPITSQVLEEEIERRVGAAQPESREAMRQRYADMPIPETEPTYMRLLVDEDGSVWAQDFQPQGNGRTPSPSRWTVFSDEGRVIAKASLPVGFTPHQVTRDGALGVYRDPLGVQFVWFVPIEKGS